MTGLRNGSGHGPRAQSLSRNTAALGMGYLLRTPVLLVYFVLATRSLGVETYGVLAAVMALCAIAGPLASMGTNTLIIKHVSRDVDSARAWFGAGLSVSALGSVALGAAVLLAAPVLLPPGTPVVALALLLVGELVLARVIELSGAVFVATERMHLKTVIQLGFPTVRLAAVAVLIAGPWPVTLTGWAVAAVLGSGVWAAISFGLATGAVGRPRWSMHIYRSDWRQGLLFVAGQGTTNVHDEADKVVLARLGGPEAAGVYAAAYRLIDVAYTPVRALLGAAYPRMFRHGASGTAAVTPLLLKVSRPALGYGLLAVPAVVLLAPFAPPVLGEGFADVAPVLVSLAGLVLLRALRALPADALSGAGHQGSRTVAQLAVAFVNVMALLVLVPRFGLWGAVSSTLATEALLAIVLWSIWARKRRAPARAARPIRRARGDHGQ